MPARGTIGPLAGHRTGRARGRAGPPCGPAGGSRTNSRCAGVCVGAPHSPQVSSGCSCTTVPGDDRAPHPVAVVEVDGARRADLGAGAAADAQLRRPREVEVGEPAGRRVGHAQRLDAHLAAGDHAQAAADADVAAQAAAGLVVGHRVGQALLDPDVVALAEDLLDGPLGHHRTGPDRCDRARRTCSGIDLGAAHRLADAWCPWAPRAARRRWKPRRSCRSGSPRRPSAGRAAHRRRRRRPARWSSGSWGRRR